MSKNSQKRHEFDVFLSYARKDTQRARLLRGYFRSHNINSWLDLDYIRRTQPIIGDEKLSENLQERILDCRYFVVLISDDSIKDNKWVKLETEFAYKQYRDGKIEGIIGIQIDEIESEDLPDWLNIIPRREISKKTLEDHDRLSEIRNEIGKNIPTYIKDVSPNFIKQIQLSQMTDHLQMCDGETFNFWYLNGGFSAGHYIHPALNSLFRQEPDKVLKANIMLLDAFEIEGFDIDTKTMTQEAAINFEEMLHDRLADSEFYQVKGDHFRQLKQTFKVFQELEKKHTNFSFEFRVTKRIPAGRIIIYGDVGFFSPFMNKEDATLPFFVFDRNSPFYTPVKDYFDDAFKNGRIVTSEMLNL